MGKFIRATNLEKPSKQITERVLFVLRCLQVKYSNVHNKSNKNNLNAKISGKWQEFTKVRLKFQGALCIFRFQAMELDDNIEFKKWKP